MLILFILMLDFLLSLVFILPLKDERGKGKRFPIMTLTVVVINMLVHIGFHVILPALVPDEAAMEEIAYALMHTPQAILAGEGLGAASVITSTFFHADWSHLIGNMLYLWFFGRKVEDLMGPWKFAQFYLCCTFVTSVGSTLGELALPMTQGYIPSLGASGVIMGVMGAYMFLYSDQRIRALLMILIIPIPVRIPVWFFVLFSVLRDTTGGWLQAELETMGYMYSMVGFFAHLSGFVAGMASIYLFLPAEILSYRYKPRVVRENQQQM